MVAGKKRPRQMALDSLVELTAPPTTLMRAIQTTFPGANVSITHTQGLV